MWIYKLHTRAVRCTEASGKCGLANSSRRYSTIIRNNVCNTKISLCVQLLTSSEVQVFRITVRPHTPGGRWTQQDREKVKLAAIRVMLQGCHTPCGLARPVKRSGLNRLRRYAALGVPYGRRARSFILQFQGHGHLITIEARSFLITHRLTRRRVFQYFSILYRLLSGMHEVSSESGPLKDDAVLLRSSE